MRYQRRQEIGSGGMGSVYLVSDQMGGIWAMKEVKSQFIEIEILKKIQHPCIPMYHDSFKEMNKTYMVMKHMQGMNLTTYLQLFGPIEEEKARNWMLQLIDILLYLHAQHILYCDVKPENILCSYTNTISLIDFGIAIYSNNQVGRVPYGTIGYAPQEQYENNEIDEGVDMYALAKTMIALISGVYNGENLQAVKVSELSISTSFQNMLERCTFEHRKDRYANMQEVKEALLQLSLETSRVNKLYMYIPAMLFCLLLLVLYE